MVQEVKAAEAWKRLSGSESAILVDVRTRAEWTFVGVPQFGDAGSTSRRALLIEWQGFPGGQPNAAFVEQLREALAELGASHSNDIYFLCRSGARSLAAARAAEQAGFPQCWNISDGFEGPLDSEGHRGRIGGWKAAGLPWSQQ